VASLELFQVSALGELLGRLVGQSLEVLLGKSLKVPSMESLEVQERLAAQSREP
jgi:hypothetical protein